jgi:phosphomannomutase / phosphoglucomutase
LNVSIFKACDIRGVFGEELGPSHATALGYALAIREKPDHVLVGGDGRISTPILKDALIRALVECGANVVNLGRVPTPVFYFALRKLGIRTGVMVTGSHNPPSDNGFKVVLGSLPITEEELGEIRLLMVSGTRCGEASRGKVVPLRLTEEYKPFAESLFTTRGGLRIVVDSGNGMWGPTAPGVFRDLGYQVIELFSDVDGHFLNRPPNPAIAANLNALCVAVRTEHADLGVAFDGDGDRVAFVDERGEPADNDSIIVLLARDALAKHSGAVIVLDQKCSDVVREEIERCGGVARMEKSGHTFIKTTFLETRAAYAGELSGHHFFEELGGDDGLIASLKMAALVQASGESISQLVARVPHYPITPDIRLSVAPGEGDAIIAALKKDLEGAAEISERDGVRAQFRDGWGLVRASVTEPALTLRFEGHTGEALERIKRQFVHAAPQLAGRI